MKILHIISSIDISSGGPSKSVCDLAIYQALKGQDVTLLTKPSANPYLMGISHTNLRLIFVTADTFKRTLTDLVNKVEFDLFHGHGLWQLPVHQMTSVARKKNRPYIISPRGMLEPWSLEQSKLKKKLALWLYQYNDIANANCVHATGKMEAENIRKLGFSNPIAVIPNGIDLLEFPLHNKTDANSKTILFLSRIHKKKGIELLIEAWHHIEKSLRKEWAIKIAGNGNEEYIKELKNLIINKSFDNEIEIVGPKFGKEKIQSYHQTDLFVLPTYSENFGIVVAEALACGIPVITTKGAPWEELNTYNAGWWIDIGVEPLAKALTDAMQLYDNERKQMGMNGRKLVEEKYSIESVAHKMIQLYEWILYKKEKPEFIFN